MELKDFIGQVVFWGDSGRRHLLKEITAPEICIVTEKPGSSGYLEHYVFRTINGDPFSNGTLIFENPALKEPFIEAFEAYSRTEDARCENYFYWLRRD